MQHVDPAALARLRAADEHGLAAQDGVTEDGEALIAQRGAGLDDVGDGVGHAEGDGGLDGPVEPDDVSGHAPLREVGADQAWVRGRDPLALEPLRVRDSAGHGGEAEGRAREAQRHELLGGAPGVEQQVATRDAGVDPPHTDVDRDVAGTQVEELGVVVGVADDELLAVTTDPVARLTEHRDGRLGERSLVGDGDTHRSGLRGGSRRRRGSGRWRA